jgi:hypothetical protein
MVKYEKLLPNDIDGTGRNGAHKSVLRRDIENIPPGNKMQLEHFREYWRSSFIVTEIRKNPTYKSHVWKRFQKDGKFYIARIK